MNLICFIMFNKGHKLGLHIVIQLLIFIIPVGLFLAGGVISANKVMKEPYHGDPFLGVAIMSVLMYVCWIGYLLLACIPLHIKKQYRLRNANLIIAAIALLIFWVIRCLCFR